jgi:hypothetical protein
LVEFIEGIEGICGEDARFGIANVQPNRALKKCRIRILRVEYFLTKAAVFLIPPKHCSVCDRRDVCTDDFVLQIIEKYNANNKDSAAYYLL